MSPELLHQSFVFYAEFNAVCFILFAIMLVHDLTAVDRQEKRIKFDYALIAFMAYFAADAVWSAVLRQQIPRTEVSVAVCNFVVFACMAGITMSWLLYAMAVEQIPNRNKAVVHGIIVLPFLLSAAVMVILWFVEPSVLFEMDSSAQNYLTPTVGYFAFLIVVPSVYIVAVMIHTMRRFKAETAPGEKRKHFFVGIFPVGVIVGGLIQTFLVPEIPLFCQCAAALMLSFYLLSMDTQISTDALTGLNNRGQLQRYISVKSNLYPEGRLTFLTMFDVNSFKMINDTYGHAEGDRALVLVAEAMRNAVKGREMPGFLGRYGGDEFLLIAHPVHKEEMDLLLEDIRSRIEAAAGANSLPYRLSVGAGCDELLPGGQDTFQKCLQRADKKLYLDKEYRKLHEAAEDAE